MSNISEKLKIKNDIVEFIKRLKINIYGIFYKKEKQNYNVGK